MNQSQQQIPQQNLMAVLAYLGWFVTGIFFLIVEKNNRFVRFHAAQSIVALGGVFVLQLIIAEFPLVGFYLQPLVDLLGVLLWLFLMYQAYLGNMYKLPYAGEWADGLLAKL